MSCPRSSQANFWDKQATKTLILLVSTLNQKSDGLLIRDTSATAALARYDQMLKTMPARDILLTPLRSQEAVISSRMEGTVSTLDEIMRYEAEHEEDAGDADRHSRSEAVEVYLYGRAMQVAQEQIREGAPISAWLIRSAHRMLLSFGRGEQMSPGLFKTEQNYLADSLRRRILFVPISPERLGDGLDRLFAFMADPDWEILIRTAIAHLEFEALHPFNDGNGRIGRMIIPLMLWTSGLLSEPHFYVSDYFEAHRDEYIDRMRDVSATDNWVEWIAFFLAGLEAQARRNLEKAEQMRDLYAGMKERFRDLLPSKWHITTLDFLFTRPVFRNSRFTGTSGIPAPTAHKFIRNLVDAGLLRTLDPAAGRRPALYAFEPLLALVRG